MNWLILLGLGLGTAVVVSLLFWLVALVTDASVLDATWGVANAMVAVIYASWTVVMRGRLSFIPLLAAVLALIWGVRLTTFVLLRNQQLQGRTSTYGRRYLHQSGFALRLLLNVSPVQIVSVFVVSSSFLFIQQYESTFTPLIIVGIIVWGVGVVIETTADQQLLLFKANPAHHGLRLMTGLWSISRHPNYFGEVLVWWGFSFIALATPLGWLALLSPLMMTIVMGMNAFKDRDGSCQADETDYYRRSVSAFVPWFPRHG